MVPDFLHIEVNCQNKVAFAQLARPKKANALNEVLWFELERLALWADQTPEVRVLVLSGQGKNFCAGIDFNLAGSLFAKIAHLPQGQKQEALYVHILELQRAFTAFEKCRKPVIAAVHGSCIGGGLDLITACDLRYAVSDAVFSIKEIDLGIVADIGTLQRLPYLIGEGMVRELAFTGQHFNAEEAQKMGLINSVHNSYDEMMSKVQSVAYTIAKKSPLTIRGIKQTLNHSREHSVAEGLDRVALLNASLLLSNDTQEAMSAMVNQKQVQFKD